MALDGSSALAIPVSDKADTAERLLLLLGSPQTGTPIYPTDRLAKGWLLSCNKQVLSEEGTGFALPIVRYGHRTVFPASARVAVGKSEGSVAAEVTYEFALVERLAIGSTSIGSEAFYWARESFSTVHRKLPPLRKGMALLFDGVRDWFHLKTRFEPCQPVGTAKVTTTVHSGDGRIAISVDFDLLKRGCTELIVANEQGASYFDLYRDSSGATLEKDAIGSWGEITAESTSFVDRRDGVLFSVNRMPGARLFRGWEMKLGRLAWAGLNYVLPPDVRHFEYDLRIAEL